MAAAQELVHPRYLRSEELGQEITQLCGYIFAATYRLLVMIREFDQDKLWADDGICSCAHWLNYKCGIGLNAAREKVRVANALEDLPKISASFEKGELSYSKVRAMTRIATPATEETLLMWARHSTAHHMETLASKYRKATRYQVMLHVSAETLTGDVTAETSEDASIDRSCESPQSHIEHGPHVSAETSKRLCCDSNVIPSPP